MESAFRRLTFDHPYALQRSTPVVGEPQKVECPWFGVAPSLGGGVVVWERLEPDQARLLRVDRQTVLAHPLGQDFHDPPGVVFSGHPDHEVVRIANQEGFSFQAGANFLRKPFVKHVVQDDVGQQGTDHAPNNVANHLVGGPPSKGDGLTRYTMRTSCSSISTFFTKA